ncbi:hypothetical protein F7018_01080 [Tenacibaculum aiptasiae]|uniref:Lipoprotein n=1 Tax=Tenacibaculum aiptasiae TaxID=426481 RepID=A0A7J5ASG4_9FLAO|nr:hypothetical protein [Tenacibaculum aiptasiae]KAB1160499.1 hypothetical protein F7018_01080 [Tenacibaculum aiptasiae]
MKNTFHILIPFLIIIISCHAQKQIFTNQELVLSDLKDEYAGNSIQKNRISNNIFSLLRNNNYEILTTSFQSILTGEYKALLYLIAEKKIIDKIERLNYKYHSGTFKLSNDLKNNQNQVLYKIFLPTTSVPHIVTLHEYFEIDKNKKIISQFKFYSEERDCTMGREKGELIKRSINSENGNYYLTKSIYEFDCEDFEFKNEIKNLKLVSREKEKLPITIPKQH